MTPRRARQILALAARLQELEQRFGGYVTDLEVRAASEHGPYYPWLTGGDRMSDEHHGYATHYARHLVDRLDLPRPTVLEIGVLRGTGLAIWSEIFDRPHVIGLDIDLSHFEDALPDLLANGAFSACTPEVYEFDQLDRPATRLDRILHGRQVDVYIDDGLHSKEAVLMSLAAVLPHLAPGAVCFVEDCPDVAGAIRRALPGKYHVVDKGELTIIECPAYSSNPIEGEP